MIKGTISTLLLILVHLGALTLKEMGHGEVGLQIGLGKHRVLPATNQLVHAWLPLVLNLETLECLDLL